MTTKLNKIMVTCDACSSKFQFGHGLYGGQRIPTYQVTVCMNCYRSNWDGWAPHLEDAITANLRSKGLKLPKRNDRGLLPLE